MKNFIYTGQIHNADIGDAAITFTYGNEYFLDEKNRRVKRMIALGDLKEAKKQPNATKTNKDNNKNKGGN